MEISIVIPCYNEHPTVLKNTINEIKEGFSENKEIKYEIVVVNDGSKGYNYELQEDNVRIITHKQNKGYGASLKTGIKNSKYSWIGITDADGTYPNKEFSKLVKLSKDQDMVVGARNKKDLSLIKRIPKWFLIRLSSYLANNKIPDLNSGMRIFKKDLALRFENLYPEGFSFTSTITMAFLTNNLNVKYTKISYNKRKGKSKIHPIKDTVRFFSLVLRLSLYFNPIRFFMPLSSMLFLAAIARGIRDFIIQDSLGGLTLILFFMSFQVFFFGLIAEIINKRTNL